MDKIELSKTSNQNLGFFDPIALKQWDQEYVRVKSMYYMDIAIWVEYQEEDSMTVTFATISDYKIVMNMEMSKVHRRKKSPTWHVDIVHMDKKFRGKGLAPKLYKHLVKALDIVIQAGEAQSPGGRYIWNKLAASHDVTVYGKFNHGQWHVMESSEDGEPWFGYMRGSDLQPYDGREFTMYLSAA